MTIRGMSRFFADFMLQVLSPVINDYSHRAEYERQNDHENDHYSRGNGRRCLVLVQSVVYCNVENSRYKGTYPKTTDQLTNPTIIQRTAVEDVDENGMKDIQLP